MVLFIARSSKKVFQSRVSGNFIRGREWEVRMKTWLGWGQTLSIFQSYFQSIYICFMFDSISTVPAFTKPILLLETWVSGFFYSIVVDIIVVLINRRCEVGKLIWVSTLDSGSPHKGRLQLQYLYLSSSDHFSKICQIAVSIVHIAVVGLVRMLRAV